MRDDDFSQSTKRLLAARVGHVCSNPYCRAPTSGPQLESDKAVTAGDAANITAASPNGPRYDPTLTSEERRSPNNGIWLCVNDARIVDQDKFRYTVKLLRCWKAEAEEEAEKRLARPRHSFASTESIGRFSRHAKSIIAALNHYGGKSVMLGIQGEVTQMGVNGVTLKSGHNRLDEVAFFMPRKPRVEYPGAIYHVMSRANGKGKSLRQTWTFTFI